MRCPYGKRYTLLSGAVAFTVDHCALHLQPGACIEVQALRTHGYAALGHTPSRLLMLVRSRGYETFLLALNGLDIARDWATVRQTFAEFGMVMEMF
jgi:hypothetical protein